MNFKKISALILSLVMIFSIIPFAYAESSVTRIIAGSDFQHPDGNANGQKTVSAIIGSMKNDGVGSADALIFCGDYDHDLTMNSICTSQGIKALTEVTDTFVDPSAQHIFVQGNHDSSLKKVAGLAPSGNNDPENGKYGVFVINEDDYIWVNPSREVVRVTADNLRNYLNEKLEQNFTAPVFVVSHLPLHYTCRTRNFGDAKYASYIFDVINEAGAKGLNIFFLYGHDHASGWDDYLGGAAVCLEKGETLNVCEGNQLKFKECTLNFTYLNAGFTGYYDNHNGGDDALTMTLFEIRDDSVTISRYDKNGKHNLSSAGVRNEYKNEKGYDPNTNVKESGFVVPLTQISDNTPIEGEMSFITKIFNAFLTIIKNLFGGVC